MDGIVYGISAINFQQNSNDSTNANCATNHFRGGAHKYSATTDMADAAAASQPTPAKMLNFETLPPVSICQFQAALNSNQITDTATAETNTAHLSATNPDIDANEQYAEASDELNSSAETVAADEACCSSKFRRKLPTRGAKEKSTLSKTKRRSIMKPTKRLSKSATDFSALQPADIKKIYLNKKLTNFHPAKLETIFEEPLPLNARRQTEAANDASDVAEAQQQVRFIGARKLKRSLSFGSGLDTNKTVVKQRRLKIKKSFGQRLRLKKISLDDFLLRLNKSYDEDDEDEDRVKDEVQQNEAKVNEDVMTETSPVEQAAEAMEAEESTPAVVEVLLKSAPNFAGACGDAQQLIKTVEM